MPKSHALPHYLRVALALSSATMAGCGGGTKAASTPTTVSGGDAGASETNGTATSIGGDGPISKVDDYTGGEGPCRCSWDTNATAAPRVCKKGETSYSGAYCLPRKRPKYYPPVIGPLNPPDLPC